MLVIDKRPFVKGRSAAIAGDGREQRTGLRLIRRCGHQILKRFLL